MYIGAGNFTKVTLPSGYTQVEYIQSNGSSYIDTGVLSSSALEIDITFDAVNLSSSSYARFFFGAEQSTKRFVLWYGLVADDSYSTRRFSFKVGNDVGIAAQKLTEGGPKRVSFSNTGVKQYVDGVWKTLHSFDGGTWTGSYNIHLFKWNQGSTDNSSDKRIYACKMYNNGTIVRDFVPAKNSSGVVGLYDIVNNSFYTDAAGGSFTCGDVYKSNISRKVKKMYIGVEEMPTTGSLSLPSGYTQLEYIESTGTQYIDTGFIPNQDTRVKGKFVIPVDGSTNFLFGSRTSGTSNNYMFVASNSNYYLSGYNTTQDAFASSYNSSNPITIDKNKQTTTITLSDGTSGSVSGTYGNFSAPYNMVLFGCNNNGSMRYGKCRIYNISIYDNGSPVMLCKAAVNSAGVAGLYDEYNGIFYTNAGTGEFVKGPALGPVARKVKKAYIGDENGIARLFFGGVDPATMTISYTGNYTDQADVVMSGKTYRLLTLTSSGTLTLEDSVQADVWLCGGGSSGLADTGGQGGGGGYFTLSENYNINSPVACVIGAGGATNSNYKTFNAGGQSSFGTITANGASNKNGASGGGGGYDNFAGGSGGGKSTVPFGETSLFDQHSAGGGGGSMRDRESSDYAQGGNGGSNGANGSSATDGKYQASTGGTKGGGAGPKPAASDSSCYGGAATFYGSGGGGASYYISTGGNHYWGYGGAGYQGVVYVRIPYEQ